VPWHSAGGSRSSAWHASPYIHTHPCTSRVLSVRLTSGETRTLEARLCASPLLADASRSAAGHLAAVNLLRARVSTPSAVAAAVKAELLRKVTTEEVKGMQRDLVVQLWSNHGCVRPALQVGVRRHRHLN
jgi:hypothetical protein